MRDKLKIYQYANREDRFSSKNQGKKDGILCAIRSGIRKSSRMALDSG